MIDMGQTHTRSTVTDANANLRRADADYHMADAENRRADAEYKRAEGSNLIGIGLIVAIIAAACAVAVAAM